MDAFTYITMRYYHGGILNRKSRKPLYEGEEITHIFDVDIDKMSYFELTNDIKELKYTTSCTFYVRPPRSDFLLDIQNDKGIFELSQSFKDGDIVEIYVCHMVDELGGPIGLLEYTPTNEKSFGAFNKEGERGDHEGERVGDQNGNDAATTIGRHERYEGKIGRCVDMRVRTQEFATQPLEIFNPSGQNDEGSSSQSSDTSKREEGGQQENLPPQVIRPQMRAQHNLEEHDSFDGDNYGYGIDDQAQQERLSGRGRRRRGNGGWHPVDGREYNRMNDDEDRGFNIIKITLPFFKGSSDSNEYLDWIVKLERQYNLNNVSGVKKMNYAISHLEGFASTWWEKIERDALVNRNFVTN
ncbi:hypothetical protein H5410_046991 [Solanum commersonii]|uniref:PB1-like domain-containing protein n=1 Tax=Solanum commersonii TaxID=4109 RepID=A0A9J5XFU6_SOLCO|nr:hypothetical protein H5410_046991 [Solanum commersonii]